MTSLAFSYTVTQLFYPGSTKNDYVGKAQGALGKRLMNMVTMVKNSAHHIRMYN